MSNGLQNSIDSAASLIRSWGAVAVVGAGASLSAGMPLVRDLQSLLWHSLDQDSEARAMLARRLRSANQPAKALIGTNEKSSKIALELIGSHALARRTYQEGFSRLNASRVLTPSKCHDALAELVHRNRIEIVVSLNWDTHIETSYQRKYGVLPRKDCFYKPHGDAAHPEIPWILPHEKGEISAALLAQLHSLVSERPRVLLIVGYSESDEDIVRKIVRPLETHWHVIRIGPSAKGVGAIRESALKVMPALLQAINLPPEMIGWEFVSFNMQRDLSAALLGQRLGPTDVVACPRLSEVDVVTRMLKQRHAVWLTGKSGSGKTITAYQTAHDLTKEGYEVLRLKQLESSEEDMIMSVSGITRPTLLLLDDAQRLSLDLIFRITELASANLLLLCVATADDSQRMVSVKIDEKRALSEIKGFLLANRDSTLKAVRLLDNQVGEGYLDTSIEIRIDDAAKSETPWEFMFILTGGWRRTRHELAILYEKERLDLLLAIIAVQQIITLDGSAPQPWLNQAAAILEHDEQWLARGLTELSHRRLIVGENAFRCPHRRFAAAVLEIVCERNDPDNWPRLVAVFRQALVRSSSPLRGISWFLNELRGTNTWERAKSGFLVTKELLAELLARCFSAKSGTERRDALLALIAIMDWHPRAFSQIQLRIEDLSDWLTTIDEDYAAVFGHFLNQFGQIDRAFTTQIMDGADAKSVAIKASSATVGAAASWGRLLNESWHSSIHWRRRIAGNLDVAKLHTLFRRVSKDDISKTCILAEGILTLDQKLTTKLIKLALPAIGQALNTDPVRVSAEISRSVIWRILGFYPEFLADKPPSKKQVALAKQLIKQLNAKKIATALRRCRQRDWEEYSRFLHFVRRVSPQLWRKIVAAIDLDSLDAATEGLWADVPSELENLLRSISRVPRFEPARSMMARRREEIQVLRPILVIFAPKIAAERIRAGVKLELHVESGSGWRLAALALFLLGKLDKSIASTVILHNLTGITGGFNKLQKLDAKYFPLFVEMLKSYAPEVAKSIALGIRPQEAKRYWIERASGDKTERRAVRSLLKFMPMTTSSLRSLGRGVGKQLKRRRRIVYRKFKM